MDVKGQGSSRRICVCCSKHNQKGRTPPLAGSMQLSTQTSRLFTQGPQSPSTAANVASPPQHTVLCRLSDQTFLLSLLLAEATVLSPRPASLTSGALKKEGTLRGAVNVMPGPECKRSTTETGAPCGTEDSSGRLAPVFVYGTLKTGQPNHRVLLDGAHGCAAFRGRARTLEPYPLVIAGEHNIPRLLNLPGRGHRVFGEVYEVDLRMLRFLDEFESCPDMYQRTRLHVALEGARAPLECFVYTTATYPPEWVHLPYLDDYDSQGKHGLRYNPRENR
ncbi:gamma-glutamylaminecyclotransferase isoform X2 [Bubalus bubalis]|uniref:gamma-glutamylaminecyclotransferase isoform X2 n=1 Tax=Bubalus bubalis TaxID=89462 RepID=UPI001D108179|nr:gamma-glutamylaminecyclotransferase isoform X2 [Bubalus bubalis]